MIRYLQCLGSIECASEKILKYPLSLVAVQWVKVPSRSVMATPGPLPANLYLCYPSESSRKCDYKWTWAFLFSDFYSGLAPQCLIGDFSTRLSMYCHKASHLLWHFPHFFSSLTFQLLILHQIRPLLTIRCSCNAGTVLDIACLARIAVLQHFRRLDLAIMQIGRFGVGSAAEVRSVQFFSIFCEP